MKNPDMFDDNFNPSPFDDKNKEDLDEVLREVEIRNKELQDTLNELLRFLLFHKSQVVIKNKTTSKTGKMLKHLQPKIPFWPLMFFVVTNHNDPLLRDTSVFMAMLDRKNKETILGFAYDWLVKHEQLASTQSKKDFIEMYWKINFENKMT